MALQQLILVTEQDEAIGTMEKMEAHRRGILHRAFSIFIFDSEGRMLLQKRAEKKYHGALLCSNTSCSHPYPEETVEVAAHRRLQEEMGFDTKLENIFSFIYCETVENNLVEHEYDHVFVGKYEGRINVNRNEVEDFTYMEMSEIKRRINEQPGDYTKWFKIVLPRIEEWWRNRYDKFVEKTNI
jgi:isopentenyl-diphosphate delta-isomerase